MQKMEGKKIAVTKSSQEGSWSDPAPESALLSKGILCTKKHAAKIHRLKI